MPRFALVCLALYAVALITRIPSVLAARRFWAEDGATFYRFAFEFGVFDALLSTQVGYFLLIPNAAGAIAAGALPPEFAPLAAISISFVVQLLPAIAIATGGSPEFSKGWRLPVALALVLLVPMSEECHLNTANSQVHLMLCTALILAGRVGRGTPERFRQCVLVVGGLTGLASVALVPLFWLRAGFAVRAREERARGRVVHAVLLSLCAALQIGAIAVSTDAQRRSFSFDPATLITWVGTNHVALPLLGDDRAEEIGDEAVRALRKGELPTGPMAAALAAAAALFALAWRAGSATPRWLLATGAFAVLTSYFGAMGMKLNLVVPYLGHRYSYASNALLALGIFAALGPTSLLGRRPRAIVAAIVAWLVLIGAAGYFTVRDLVSVGPSWPEEVAAWRRDPASTLAIWPNGWTLELPASTAVPEHPSSRR